MNRLAALFSPALRRAVTKASGPDLPPLRMLPHRQVPVIIKQLQPSRLAAPVDGVAYAGQAREDRHHRQCLALQPLRDYLTSLEAARLATVLRLDGNYGHKALWERGLLSQLGIETEYVYTDPDVVPCDFCPADAIRFLQVVLASEPRIARVGLGLRLDDLPDSYRHKREAIGWERHFWLEAGGARPLLRQARHDLRLYRPRGGLDSDCRRCAPAGPISPPTKAGTSTSARPSDEDLVYSREASPK